MTTYTSVLRRTCRRRNSARSSLLRCEQSFTPTRRRWMPPTGPPTRNDGGRNLTTTGRPRTWKDGLREEGPETRRCLLGRSGPEAWNGNQEDQTGGGRFQRFLQNVRFTRRGSSPDRQR